MGAGWELWLGSWRCWGFLSLFSASAAAYAGGLGIGSVNRNPWPDPGFVLAQGSPRVVVTRRRLSLPIAFRM